MTAAPLAGGAAPAPTLASTAVRLGGWRWVDLRLFEVVGGWAAEVPEPAAKVWLAAAARHHAWRADQWTDRFPRLREFDLAAATVAPDGWEPALAALSGTGRPPGEVPTAARLAGLVRVVLPRLVVGHDALLSALSPEADGALRRTLKMVVADEVDDWRTGESILQALLVDGSVVAQAAAAQATLEATLVPFPGSGAD
jgi:hypothetical protein